METLFIDEFDSPLGKIIIALSHRGVERVIISAVGNRQSLQLNEHIKRDPIICRDAIDQLQEYFAGTRQSFTVPFHSEGSQFCLSVWHIMQTIPYGKTMSYADIAQRVGNPDACRAVGAACRSNPLPLLIPCHRVINKQSSLSGYLGKNYSIKQFLLNLEKKMCH